MVRTYFKKTETDGKTTTYKEMFNAEVGVMHRNYKKGLTDLSLIWRPDEMLAETDEELQELIKDWRDDLCHAIKQNRYWKQINTKTRVPNYGVKINGQLVFELNKALPKIWTRTDDEIQSVVDAIPIDIMENGRLHIEYGTRYVQRKKRAS